MPLGPSLRECWTFRSKSKSLSKSPSALWDSFRECAGNDARLDKRSFYERILHKGFNQGTFAISGRRTRGFDGINLLSTSTEEAQEAMSYAQ
jgi:hypothetical protein